MQFSKYWTIFQNFYEEKEYLARKSILAKSKFIIFTNKNHLEKIHKLYFFVQNSKIVTIFWKATIEPKARFFRYDSQKKKNFTKIDFWDLGSEISIKVLLWHTFFHFFSFSKKSFLNPLGPELWVKQLERSVRADRVSHGGHPS